MEAKLVIKASDVTPDFIDGIMKVFSKDAVLDIIVNYDPQANSTATAQTRGPKPQATPVKGAKRGPKPKVKQEEAPEQAPKKRGRKPKVVSEAQNG